MTDLTDRDEQILVEAEEKLRKKREAQTKPLSLTAHVVGGLDPEGWPLATCPTCDSSPRRVPPPVLRRRGIDLDAESPEIPCDDCVVRSTAAEAERVQEANVRRQEAERRRRRENLPSLLSKAGAPPVYARLSRETWEARYGLWEDHEKSRRYIGWPGDGFDLYDGDQIICLYGLYGRRKTGFATAILGECIVAGMSAVWIDTATWLRAMKADGFSRQDAEWERVISADVRLFDDFGGVVGSRGARSESWDLEKMAEVARYCHMNALPTIYTTNGSLDDLAAIDGSLPSRFATRLAIEMRGQDRRIDPLSQ